MIWDSKKVLVTGAGGFIGSHLIEHLVPLGAAVSAFVRYNSYNNWGMLEKMDRHVLAEVKIHCGDLKDPEAVRKAVKKQDIIFHLGSLIAIPFSYTNPRDFVDTNVVGTANVLNAALEYGIERLIHTSTSEVYGTARYVPIDENHPLQAQSPYSATKIAADKLVESYYRSFGLPASIIRPFNTYGPRQSARAVISTIILQALVTKHITLGSLEPTRDFNYVEDTVAGFIKVAGSERSIGEVINIGTGQDISIGQLAQKIINRIDKNIILSCDQERIRPKNSEVMRLVANNTKAKTLLEWSPQYSLDEGLEKTIAWFRKEKTYFKAEIYNV